MLKKILSTLLALGSLAPSAMAEKVTAGKESHFISAPRQLVFEGKRSGEGYFSADGIQMIFQSERDPKNPFYQIYVMDLTTGDVERVSTGVGKTSCGWLHPDNNRLLFASTHADPETLTKQQAELDFRASGKTRRYSWDYDPAYEIYELDRTTKAYKNLTNAVGYDAEGAYSPDGEWIVFASNRRAYDRKLTPEAAERLGRDPSYFMDIYIMKADGSELKRLTKTPGYDGGPFFSPDGERIVWRRFSENGATAEIYTINKDGTDEKKLTDLKVMSWAPYFHPSGDYIIFTNNQQGFDNFELYIVDTEGKKKPVRVTYRDGFDGLPVFSPDGARISWSSKNTTEGGSQIFMGDWNDAAAREALGLTAPQAAYAASHPLPETSAAIDVLDLKSHVAALASEDMEGRLTGTVGEARAADYLARAFARLGLKPMGDKEAYLQAFTFTPGQRKEEKKQKNAAKAIGKNVLGLLETDAPKDAPWIVIGAHYDHLGHGEDGGSRARAAEAGGIHYGADDNASGVAALLEIAEHLVDQKAKGKLAAKHNILFASWSGEELGLLGSTHFVKSLEKSIKSKGDLSGRVAAYLNMDMVGRVRDHLYLQGAGSSSAWRGEIERRNVPVGLPLSLAQDAYLPTDATVFYTRKVPILSAFSGSHDDYSTPRDTAEKLNYDDLRKVAQLIGGIGRGLALKEGQPDYVEQDKPKEGPGRSKSKIFLGTIPEYGGDGGKGVPLSGAQKGSPAEKAGVQSGDTLVGLGGKDIKTIYDFVGLLDGLKADQPIEMVVMREGKKINLTIVPKAKK